MDFSIANLIPGFIFGVFGLYVFQQGRKKVSYTLVFTGLALMIYPYFVENAWLNWAIGGGLLFFAYRNRH